MKKALSLLVLLLVCTHYLISQNYNNIVNYHFNSTHQHGIKIKTNLPFVNSSQMPIVNIVGYNYNANASTTSTLNLQISWSIYDGLFYVPTMSSSGGSAPTVWLSNENGKVVIFLDQKVFHQRFTISAFAQGMAEKPEYFAGWTVKDEARGGTAQVKVPYKNVFGDKVGIGTETPQYTLDVNGSVRGESLYLENSFYSGSNGYARIYYPGVSLMVGTLPYSATDCALDIRPGEIESGSKQSVITMWQANSQKAFEKKIQIRTNGDSYFNGGNVGIGTTTPKNKLEVAGTIRATEVKVETGWADFVFDKDYKLPSLEEVESYINEYKRLPDIPSESQVKEEGVGLGEMQVKLLQKIEELTLYIIKQEKRIQELEKKK